MPIQNPETLRIWSFHSVKGGVGKSTLSWLMSRALAERHRPVALLDFDLTGTSLADALPLRAPHWDASGEDLRLPLDLPPDHHAAPGDRVLRRATLDEPHARGVPYLNDFLLWEQDAGGDRADIHPKALLWCLPEGDPLRDWLQVMPSSSAPRDLATILSLLYDEPFCAWVESRVEWLLDQLLQHTEVRDVVIDTPPTIPGLSRAILSAAMRLTEASGKISLSENGASPHALWAARVEWRPWLVTSDDRQDLQAVFRYMINHDPSETSRIGLVVNKTAVGLDTLARDFVNATEHEGGRRLESVDDEVDLARTEAIAALEAPKRGLFELGWRAVEKLDPDDRFRVFRLGAGDTDPAAAMTLAVLLSEVSPS